MGMLEKSKDVLANAYEDALNIDLPHCSHKVFIDYVIDNTHLTYKYILFTALLAKATEESINPLCLQKKSELPGAYDARSVCHKVIVPFEMTVLEKALGGSNEPFLNKPARFPELSRDNAVRRGNDQRILNSLCDNLPDIGSSDDAYECLVYLLYKLIAIREEKRSMFVFSVEDNANRPARLQFYLDKALEQSFEGETLTLMVAGIYHLAYLQNDSAVVEVHPVNQSGSSGREVSDLDIYIDNCLVSSNELKDKPFSEHDVRHAADKVISAGGDHMLFIKGPNGRETEVFAERIEAEYMSRNFLLRIIPHKYFFYTMVSSLETIDVHEFMRFILETAHETKFKEDVINYLDGLAQEVFGLSRD